MHYFVSFLVLNHLEAEERAEGFAYIVLRMSSYCKCSATLSYGAVGMSVMCNGIP